MRIAGQISLGVLGGLIGYLIGSFIGLYTFLKVPHAFFLNPFSLVLEVPMAIIIYISIKKHAYLTITMSLIPVIVGYFTCGWLIDAFARVLLSEI